MRYCLVFCAGLLGLCLTTDRAMAELVDLELVLAVDASGSVDPAEYRLQLGGIAAAFRDSEVQEAIADGPIGKIAVAVLIWADATVPKDPGPWFVVSDPAGAERFARSVEDRPRRVKGATGIGAAVAQAIRMTRRNGIESTRQVVDVSGDGEETPPREITVMMPLAQSMARASGVTINGLAILNDVPDLDHWYDAHVKTGADAFVMTADNYADFADAIRRKLIREIRARPNVAVLSPLVRRDREPNLQWTDPVEER